jgi:hypothetical protein
MVLRCAIPSTGIKGVRPKWKFNYYFKIEEHKISVRRWLAREDSNLRMPESKSGALPLGDGPSLTLLLTEFEEPVKMFN